MLDAKITRTPAETVVHLSGTIDETTDLFKAVGVPTDKKVRFVCENISRVNSVGVKIWIKYFLLLRERGIEVSFDRLSVAIVEQLNSILNFTVGGAILSVQLPYQCESCNISFSAWAGLDACKSYATEVPDCACPQCGKKAPFDEIPQEYFEFLSRL